MALHFFLSIVGVMDAMGFSCLKVYYGYYIANNCSWVKNSSPHSKICLLVLLFLYLINKSKTEIIIVNSENREVAIAWCDPFYLCLI